MAFNKFGKFIFPAVVTIFTVDTLLPIVSPLQAIPVFQGEMACDDYAVEEAVRYYIDNGIRQDNVRLNDAAQSIIRHTNSNIDRSNPLWNAFANAFEGAGREVEKTTREGTKYIVFSSFESKEISNQNGIKRCRVLANTVSNTMTGGANYITHNYIVNIKNGHVTVE
ncbi:hypothetical protein FWK45_02510 [Histophilus somni]|uniref:Uncharacterized protein n=1 Tax=Histophilus somni TaxID=731 RepID=A0A9Q6Z1Q1_HISSO|nr:hypothetical protein [Histophilus somni]ARU64448.1 hypothetical protein BTV18_02480 [Histophilus somni]ARU66235.1 hypothetical protein BTV19_02475 [Histophilus somni]ARU68109.1 hypothetical protein BTV16_02480 [Histophilus somni]ARU69990.1 hypothetical protein BTV20_02480 [Histophilus somni]ARU71864.1 hypothetical protein BTV17_02475 [Histophilus somni]